MEVVYVRFGGGLWFSVEEDLVEGIELYKGVSGFIEFGR